MGAAARVWSAAAHPRGPNGRFIKGGGGDNSNSTSRPSLADAVRGTAAGGPKRQRAERLATPASRPTPAASGRPRPGSAAAMFAAGSGKGRIHAATSRPATSSAPSSRPSVSHQASAPGAMKSDIRAAVAKLQQEQGGWVGLADLREHLGAGRSRKDVDAALNELLDEPGVRIIPVANTKALKPRDREAAVRIGGEDSHAISIDSRQAPKAKAAPNSSGPAPAAKAAPATAPRSRDHAAKAEALRLLTGERQARPAAGDTGRHPGYDGLDPRELDLILGDNSINTAGMSLEQKRAALAAYDKRIGAARFGGPSQSPAATSTGSRERTEISGWKSGQSPRRAAKTTPEGAGTAEIGAALSSATTRDQGRAALSGLTVSQLRDVAAANGVTVGSSYSKAKIRDAILQQLVGRRLDSAAIHQMTAPKKSARQIMQTGGS